MIDRKVRTALLATALVGGMTGLGFASVPLYRMFCEVTGLGGTTQRGQQAPGAVDGRKISIRFDANHASSLPWEFEPEVPTQTVTIGARNIAFFTAKNLSDKPVTGTATYNVAPTQAGMYFAKIQCFCFNEQTLQPGESVRMPVIFYVDPKMLADADAKGVAQITLSYTFYPVDASKQAS